MSYETIREYEYPEFSAPIFVNGKIPGHNVDRINVAAGLAELQRCGWHEAHTRMVIEHALQRWARGEEEAAQRGAIDAGFHGIDLTSWTRVLAAAMAHAG